MAPPMPAMAPDDVTGLGVLLRLRRNALGAFPERCRHEPLTVMRLPGRRLLIAGQGSTMVELLRDRAGDFARMPAARRVLGPIAGDGLLTSEGAEWRRQRRAVAPALAPRAMAMAGTHIVRATGEVVAALADREDRPIDLLAVMQDLSLEIAARSMFSIETTRVRDRLRTLVSDYTGGLGRPAPQDFILPSWLPTVLTMRRRAFRRRWLRLMDGVLASRAASPGAGDLFDLLASHHGAGERHLLIDQVATMIVAGHETTALTLFWALFLLARSPEWQQAIRTETAALRLSAEDAAREVAFLPVTRAIVDETLRLYSPAFMTARIAIANTTLAGKPVTRGDMVLAPFWLMHRDPALWIDGARFDPRRFLAGEPGRDRFLPFGIGPHVCVGAQLAMTEAILVVAMIVRRFSIGLAEPARPVLPVATLSTRPDKPPRFVLAPID